MKIISRSDQIRSCLYAFAFRNEYDMKANDIVRWIFELVKIKRYGEHVKDNIKVTIKQVEEGSGYLLEQERFRVVADTALNRKTKNAYVFINIYVSSAFSKLDYPKINYALYEAIRHELEHIHKFKDDRFPDDKYNQLYKSLAGNQTIEEHTRDMSEYIMSDTEIDSYARGIMYVSKKRKQNVRDVIEEILERAFFGNDSKIKSHILNNPELIATIAKTRAALIERLKKYYQGV